ncbi:glycosyltransferase family 4 protein [Azospirillum sp.]|uniref:glycosyltransferase family 4 protein n=1 Tax=Azospirillum sp. TaxID=34012 RepID=UPI002D69F304|nr:glycosyltransferase family 4 protein [Azospirillum sp.]HYD69484.1 glycosyltransferase family 4 protein [Azospirillum sp.]
MSQPDASTPATRRATAALFYHPEGFNAARAQVKGRHAAGAGFLKGFVESIGVEPFHCFTNNRAHYDDFRQRTAALKGAPCETRWHNAGNLGSLAEPGCLYLPGPGLAEAAWHRRVVDERAYSLCGVTHTVSSERAMEAIGAFLTAPVQEWDALICTTNSVRAAVEELLDGYAGYLEERVGAKPKRNAQLPVIPLGVDCDGFTRGPAEDEAGRALRARLGMADGDVAGLFLGRLVFHAKAHPVPMFMAFERAQARLGPGRKLHLMLVGQFPNSGIEREFHDAVPRFCPSVAVHILDGADPALARASWFAADLFCSLSDNIQESFGLTPVEAMAAGLPCVVSDWDGYRETVVDGETGFTIPTVAPPPLAGGDLSDRFLLELDNYDHFIGAACLATAVDIDACADAVARLAADDGLRRRMGAAGRRRALDVFDWRHVIGAYQQLWAELAERRHAAPQTAPRRAGEPASPLRADPFTMFRRHPTRLIGGEDVMRLAGADAAKRLETVLTGTLNRFGGATTVPPEGIRALIAELAAGPKRVGELLSNHPLPVRRRLIRTFAWLKKYGLVDF